MPGYGRLGCTEIALLVRPEDAPAPLFDTTGLHARSVAIWALDDETARALTGVSSTARP